MSLMQQVSAGPQTSTNAYVDFVTLGPVRHAGSVSFLVKNTHASATLKYRVLAADDADFTIYTIAQAEATLAASAVGDFSEIVPPHLYYKVQVTDGDGHSTCTVTGVSKF